MSITQTKSVSFRGVICHGREVVRKALATVALKKSSDITLDQLRSAVYEAMRSDKRFPSVKSKNGDYTNTPWLRDVLMPETDGGEWTVIIQEATSTGNGDMVKLGFTVAADGTVAFVKGDPQPTKMIYKSASFKGVLGSGVGRERAVALVSAAGDALKKSADAPAPAPERTTFATSFALSKGNNGHTGKPGGGSFAKTRTVGNMAAKRPRFRPGQRVDVGGMIGTVVGSELRGTDNHVKVRMGTKVTSHPEGDVKLSKMM